MKTVDLILNHARRTAPSHRKNNIISFIASFFSIVFSMSLVEQAFKLISEKYVLILVVVFVILFLLFNEYHKVIELRRRFLHKKNSLFIIIFTFSINIIMSLIGIYLWTNKSFENTIKNDNEKVSTTLVIEKKYSSLIDSVNSITPGTDVLFKNLTKDLSYWKSRQPVDLEERTLIRENIKEVQNRIDKFTENFNQNKQFSIQKLENLKQQELNAVQVIQGGKQKTVARFGYISMIFFLMVLLTKIIILFLAKEYAEIEIKFIDQEEKSNDFLSQYRIVTAIYLVKDKIEFNDIVYSKFRREDQHPKDIFYFFGNLGINTCGNAKAAQKILKNYYETIYNL
jgi:hypothetical protein